MPRQTKKGLTQAETSAAAIETKAASAEPAKPQAPARASRKAATPKAASAASKKPATRKPAARKTTAKTSAAAGTNGAAALSPEQRYRMIQDAAYFIAERNGFTGDSCAYWLEAEKTIDAQLGSQ